MSHNALSVDRMDKISRASSVQPLACVSRKPNKQVKNNSVVVNGEKNYMYGKQILARASDVYGRLVVSDRI